MQPKLVRALILEALSKTGTDISTDELNTLVDELMEDIAANVGEWMALQNLSKVDAENLSSLFNVVFHPAKFRAREL